MPVSIQLKRNGVAVGDPRSAASYTELGRFTDQLRSGGLLLKQDQGGTVTIEFSGTCTCGTCSRVVSAPGTITL